MLSPRNAGSGAKAEFGAVWFVVVVVIQAVWPPVAVAVQPAGSEGADTLSKFSANVLAWPSVKLKTKVPKFAAPSCNWSVALAAAPQLPLATKVKDRETVAPPAITP